MIKFDDSHLVELNRLNSRLLCAFANACAERACGAYFELFRVSGDGNIIKVRSLLEKAWNLIITLEPSTVNIDSDIKAVEHLLRDPDKEAENWPLLRGASDNAIIALAYAFETHQKGKPSCARAAAQNTYESLEALIMEEEPNLGDNVEHINRVVSNDVIQRELSRQARDMRELLEDGISIAELKKRAELEASTYLPKNAAI